MIDFDAEFRFNRAVGGFGLRQKLVEVPAFRHPAAGHGVDDASGHTVSGGHRPASDQNKGCAALLKRPSQ